MSSIRKHIDRTSNHPARLIRRQLVQLLQKKASEQGVDFELVWLGADKPLLLCQCQEALVLGCKKRLAYINVGVAAESEVHQCLLQLNWRLLKEVVGEVAVQIVRWEHRTWAHAPSLRGETDNGWPTSRLGEEAIRLVVLHLLDDRSGFIVCERKIGHFESCHLSINDHSRCDPLWT